MAKKDAKPLSDPTVGPNDEFPEPPELPPLPEPKVVQEREESTEQKRPKSTAKVNIPTPGRLIQYVTDERVVCPAIVTRVFKWKDSDREVITMHVNALDPIYGSRNYQIADAEAAHASALLSNELRTVEEIDKDSEVFLPGSWAWPPAYRE